MQFAENCENGFTDYLNRGRFARQKDKIKKKGHYSLTPARKLNRISTDIFKTAKK